MNWSGDVVAEVPPDVVTVTCTVPAVPTGVRTVQAVALVHDTEVAGEGPNLTVVAPVANPVPVRLTRVAPERGPALGVTVVTVGTEE